MVIDKDLYGYLSIAIVTIATVPYLIGVVRGKIKPHAFSWLIWALVAGIAAAARGAGHAGAGTWGSWANAASCLSVTILALVWGEKNITRSDVVAFLAALSAIPVWLATDNPLLAVIIVASIDVLGFYPTVRKSYIKPHEEMTFNYWVANGNHILSMLATTVYSLTTVLAPVVMFTANTAFIVMLLWRRRVVDAETAVLLTHKEV